MVSGGGVVVSGGVVVVVSGGGVVVSGGGVVVAGGGVVVAGGGVVVVGGGVVVVGGGVVVVSAGAVVVGAAAVVSSVWEQPLIPKLNTNARIRTTDAIMSKLRFIIPPPKIYFLVLQDTRGMYHFSAIFSYLLVPVKFKNFARK